MARSKGKAGAKRAPRRRRNSQMYILAAGAGVVIAAVVVVIIVLSNRGGGNSGTVDLGSYNASGKTLGSTKAAVRVVEYADFQCPYCKQAAINILPQLEKDYVNSGQVSIEFKNYPIVDRNSGDKESHLAAYAAECANDQNKFWDYYQILYNNQKNENAGDFTVPRLEAMAGGLTGIDQARFNTCLESQQFKSVVDGDVKEGNAKNVQGTPTFFVNDTEVQATYSALKSAIDKALAQAP